MPTLLEDILSGLKEIDTCNVMVSNDSVSIIGNSTNYTVYSTIPTLCNGTSTWNTYYTNHLYLSSNEYTSIIEENGYIIVINKKEEYMLRRTISPTLIKEVTEIPSTEYTSKLYIKLGTFRKILDLLKEKESTLFLSNGTLCIHSSYSESDKVIEISSITILNEGIDKIRVSLSFLSNLSSLLKYTEQVLLEFNSFYLSILLLFKDNIAHYNILVPSQVY
ncbi:hypothetical protein NEOKW01_0351 [Nematocida sp. AWRm80]|nr:hypothetical protein NEOKW01_0351 [Nematocida sp. AWRm80]